MSETVARGPPTTGFATGKRDRTRVDAHTGVRDATRDGTDAPAPGRERSPAQ